MQSVPSSRACATATASAVAVRMEPRLCCGSGEVSSDERAAAAPCTFAASMPTPSPSARLCCFSDISFALSFASAFFFTASLPWKKPAVSASPDCSALRTSSAAASASSSAAAS